MATGKDWQRLAGYVRERRAELGMTQEDVRAAGGPSTATMRLIEGALQNSYQELTLRELEKALAWEHGSVRNVLAGGEPVILSETARQPEPASVRELKPVTQGDPWWVPLPDGVSEEDVAPLTAQILRDLAPLLADLEAGEKLSGEKFPGSRLDGLAWDRLMMEKGMTAAMAARYIAIAWVGAQRRARSRGGHAAGLTALHSS